MNDLTRKEEVFLGLLEQLLYVPLMCDVMWMS